jgi:hypothetical protein
MVVDRYILKRTRDRMTRCGRDRSPWVLVVFYYILHFVHLPVVFHLRRIRRSFQACMSNLLER